VSSQVSLSSRVATADGADNLELGTPTREARRGPAGEVGSPPNPAGVPLKSDRRWWPGPRTEAARLKIKTSQKIAGQAGRGRGGPVRPALSPIQSFSALVHGRPLRGLPGELIRPPSAAVLRQGTVLQGLRGRYPLPKRGRWPLSPWRFVPVGELGPGGRGDFLGERTAEPGSASPDPVWETAFPFGPSCLRSRATSRHGSQRNPGDAPWGGGICISKPTLALSEVPWEPLTLDP